MVKCTRCGNKRKTMIIIKVRTGGHSIPPTELDDLPPCEFVCGDCLTDNEIVSELTPVVEFVLSVLIDCIEPSNLREALEAVHTIFQIRRNSDYSNRPAALKALGLR